ncbi:MAG: EamA family transporter [Chloroflexota bacterium]|nr:EamA family transporter [Chloroflexota bacterium]
MKQNISTPIAPVKSGRGHLLVYAGIWFTVSVWGTSFVAARFLLHPTSAGQVALSPTLLAALRFSIASLFFVVPLIRALVQRQITYRDLLLMALLGQIGFSLYFWLQYTGVQKTNASISSILVVGLIPIVTAFLARFFGAERHSWLTFGILLLGFCGVAIIVFQNQVTVTLRSDFLLGALCLISNAFAFAIYSNLSKRWMKGISPLLMTGGTMTSGALGLVLLTLLDPAHNRWGDVLHMDAVQWLALLFLSLVCSIIAYFLYNYALIRIDASRAAVYIYFEPVFTILLSITLLAERLSWQTILGTAVIALSVALVNLSKKQGKSILFKRFNRWTRSFFQKSSKLLEFLFR